MHISNLLLSSGVHNSVNAYYKIWTQKPKLTYLPVKQIAMHNASIYNATSQ